jgi:hypothetical protein
MVALAGNEAGLIRFGALNQALAQRPWITEWNADQGVADRDLRQSVAAFHHHGVEARCANLAVGWLETREHDMLTAQAEIDGHLLLEHPKIAERLQDFDLPGLCARR